MRILTADIGGTNARFAAFRSDSDGLVQDESLWLASEDASSFLQLLEQLEASGFSLPLKEADVIVFAVAGPVIDSSRVILPNIPWGIDVRQVAARFGVSQVLLINDFVAQAYACLQPKGKHLAVIEGAPVTGAPVAVLGAGSGFGKCLLVPAGERYITVPSEGGHAVFPFIGRHEQEFAEYLRRTTGRNEVNGDMVLSGSGLRALHAFHTGEQLSSYDVTERMKKDSKVLAWFARFYGRACRNFVLETLALGGVFVAGGIAAGNPEVLNHSEFRDNLQQCTAHSELLQNVPVTLVTDTESGLFGAALYGAQHWNHSY